MSHLGRRQISNQKWIGYTEVPQSQQPNKLFTFRLFGHYCFIIYFQLVSFRIFFSFSTYYELFLISSREANFNEPQRRKKDLKLANAYVCTYAFIESIWVSLQISNALGDAEKTKIRWHKSQLMDDKCRNISQVLFAFFSDCFGT